MNTFGRYQLVASLGRGRLTEAFKAKSFGIEGFEKTLVVKCVHPELAQDQAFAQAFVGEAKLAVRLSHANIVQVFDAGCVEEDGRSTYFLATEHVAGLTLRSIWERCGFQPLPVHLCLHVASELAKALDHAHRRSDNRHKPLGIVHANLSPDNVFLSWNGDVKVSDFCLARALARLPHRLPEHDGPHLSPEQRLGQAALAQSDVFALGSMLYRLLSGQNPFVAGSSEEVLQQIERTDFTRSGLPRELRELVERALAFPAEERFESASQFHESLLMTSYASPKRFSSQDLAEFVEEFREPPTGSAETAGSVLAGPNLQSVPPPSMHVDAGSGRARSWPPLADMRDLTVLSLRLGNVPVPATMRKRAKQIVERYGGHILAESSRELDAAFGLERTDARDTESAARSALVLVRMLGSAESEPSAGIDSGRLRAGAEGPFGEGGAGDELLGSARRLAHLVPGRVAVSESVAVNLRTAFGSEPVPAESAARLLQDTHAPPLGRFVGRHSELSELGQRLLEAGRGKVQVVGLVGEQGIGKTRLLLEIERRIKKSGLNIGFYCASCPPCGSQTLEGALLPMLRTLCSVRESDSAARLGAIEPSLRALGLRDEEVDALLAELGASPMGAGLSDRAPLRAAVRRMLLRLSEDRPHIFAWDDAQEMDADSASLLSSFVERLGHAPAMLLLSARPGGDAHYRSIVGYSEFPLHLLPEHDVRRLIAQELGVDKVPDRLFYFIQERAAGNPMFIVELLTEAKQSGAIVIEGGRVELSRLEGAAAVPRSLRALLAGRVRSLPHDLAQVVASVSVLGSPTDVVVVSNMLGLPVGEIDARADELEKRGLLRRDGASALSLPSPLLSEVVFGDLEPDELAEVHRQAAHAYQRAIADGVESDGSRAAYHLVEAGEHQAAAEAYAASGLSHLKAGRFERAVGELSQALSLVNLHTHELEPMAEWIAGLSRGIRHAPASREIALLLRRIAQHYSVRPRLDDLHASLLVVLASSLAELEDYPQATELLERVAGDASLNSSSVRAALITLAQVSIQRGEFGVAVSALSRAESLGEGDHIEQHHRLLTQAHALAGTGQRDSADAAWQRAERLTAELDVAARAESIRTRARILGLYGDWTGSADVSAEAAEVARAAGLGHEFALNLNQQGVALLRANQLPRAYAVLKNALGVAEELGSERLITKTQLLLADLDRLRGADQPR